MDKIRFFDGKKGTLFTMLLFFLFIGFSFLYDVVKYYNPYDFEIISYKMDVDIDDKGDLHIKESITNDYSNYNSVFYKQLIYSKNNSYSNINDTSSLVEDVSLLVESNGSVVFDSKTMSNSVKRFVGYSYENDLDELGNRIDCDPGVENCEMIFYYNSSGIDDITTFTYEYTIQGALTKYQDIAELNWIYLDAQSMNVKNIEININFPENTYTSDDFYAFGHGVMVGNFSFIDNNSLKINVPEIKKGELVELRLLLPNDIFPNVRSKNTSSNNVLSVLLQEETQALNYANLLRIIQLVSIIFFALFALSILLLIIYIYQKYDKEYKSSFDNKYFRELPNNYEPALMGYLYRFGKIKGDDLAATLLDLVRRKYLIIEFDTNEVNSEKANYTISLNKKMPLDRLKEYEKFFIEWYINEIGDNEKVSLVDIKRYTSNENSAIKYGKYNSIWTDKLKNEAERLNMWDQKTINAKKRYMGFVGLGFMVSFIFYLLYAQYNIDSTVTLIIGSVLLSIGLLVYLSSIKRRSKEANEDYVRWKAFKNFLEDFSTFADYPVPSLIIWEHYLVYATSFGIADKVMKQLKLKFSNVDPNDSNLTYGRYMNYNAFTNFYLLRSISTMSNVARATIVSANAARAASGVARSSGGRVGGGGFGGGRSFGGGGGSFGGR